MARFAEPLFSAHSYPLQETLLCWMIRSIRKTHLKYPIKHLFYGVFSGVSLSKHQFLNIANNLQKITYTL
jgi:hypothetical protein